MELGMIAWKKHLSKLAVKRKAANKIAKQSCKANRR